MDLRHWVARGLPASTCFGNGQSNTNSRDHRTISNGRVAVLSQVWLNTATRPFDVACPPASLGRWRIALGVVEVALAAFQTTRLQPFLFQPPLPTPPRWIPVTGLPGFNATLGLFASRQVGQCRLDPPTDRMLTPNLPVCYGSPFSSPLPDRRSLIE
mmetsp:Transcript_95792/g.165126  ORF Transcript_95792/g.165126 Transcript_95792/m.165126 type:complete len:157 (-) Transcript_95792:34-504(-)